MTDLPSGWAIASIADVADVQGGIQKQPKRRPIKNTYPFLRVANVMKNRLDLADVHAIELFDGELERFALRSGDLLVVEGNGSPDQIGRAAIWSGEIANCVHQNHLIRIRSAALVPKFFALIWNSPLVETQVRRLASSTSGLHTLSVTKLKSINLVVPPMEEQERIVAALEGYCSRLDAALRSTESIDAKGVAFRASVLDAAVRGHLSVSSDRDSSVDDLIQESQSRLGFNMGSVDKKRALPALAEQALAPYAIPREWRWVSWSSLGHSTNGSAFPSSDYSDSGIKLLRPGNLRETGRVIWDQKNTRYLPDQYALTNPRYLISGRALIMNLTAQSLKDQFLGRVCLTSQDDRFMLNQRLAWLQPVNMNPEYLLVVFRSPLFRRFVNRLNTGSLIQHIHTWQIGQFQIPVPPIEEQLRIVAAVREVLSGVERLEESSGNIAHRARWLLSGLFTEAFAGRLTSRDSTDGSVIELLDRIRDERLVEPKSRRARRTIPLSPQKEVLL